MTSTEQVCRACLKEAVENEEFLDINIVTFPHRVSLRTKLKGCVPEVNISDNESAYICTSCATLLESSYVFRNICLGTEEKLRKISSAYYSDLVKIINKKPSSETASSSSEGRRLTDEDREEVYRKGDKNVTQKSFMQRSDDKQRYILDIEQNLAISIAPHKPHHLQNKNADQVSKESLSMTRGSVKTKRKPLTEKEMIAEACQTIPELSKHKPENFECSILLEKLSENVPEKAKVEYVRDPKTNLYSCRFCPMKKNKMSYLLDHERRVHTKEKPFSCKACDKQFYQNCELKKHLRNSRKCKKSLSKPMPAQTARKRVTMTTSQVRKLRRLRKKRFFYNESSDESNLAEEMTTEKTTTTNTTSENNFETFGSLADALTGNMPLLKVKSEHPIKMEQVIKTEPGVATIGGIQTAYACEFCTEMFETEQIRNKHLETHGTYMCTLCALKFSTEGEKTVHYKSHFVNGKFFCFDCNRKVVHKDHFNLHTGKRPYICNVCQRTFASNSSLYSHRWNHKTTRPHHCPFCKQGFIKLSVKTKHIAKCPKRKRPAPPKATLTFKCEICNDAFTTEQLREEHVCKNEKGEPVFKCQVCKAMLVGRAGFIEHVKSEHFVESVGAGEDSKEEGAGQ